MKPVIHRRAEARAAVVPVEVGHGQVLAVDAELVCEGHRVRILPLFDHRVVRRAEEVGGVAAHRLGLVEDVQHAAGLVEGPQRRKGHRVKARRAVDERVHVPASVGKLRLPRQEAVAAGLAQDAIERAIEQGFVLLVGQGDDAHRRAAPLPGAAIGRQQRFDVARRGDDPPGLFNEILAVEVRRRRKKQRERLARPNGRRVPALCQLLERNAGAGGPGPAGERFVRRNRGDDLPVANFKIQRRQFDRPRFRAVFARLRPSMTISRRWAMEKNIRVWKAPGWPAPQRVTRTPSRRSSDWRYFAPRATNSLTPTSFGASLALFISKRLVGLLQRSAKKSEGTQQPSRLASPPISPLLTSQPASFSLYWLRTGLYFSSRASRWRRMNSGEMSAPSAARTIFAAPQSKDARMRAAATARRR